jgi:hypothetical protein
MRDEKDPGTIEMRLPGRKGRPALNGHAMSDAERSRRYRERRHDRMRVAVRTPEQASNAALLEELRAAMADGSGYGVHNVLREIAKRFPEVSKHRGS